MRIATRELESRSLTNSDIFAEAKMRTACVTTNGHLRIILQDMGFEPMRITTLRPQRSPLTSWVILHIPFGKKKVLPRVERGFQE